MNKYSRNQWAAGIALAWIAALLLLGLISAIFKKGIESAEAAAWVQGVGSITAIVVAIIVMNTQHQRDRRREHCRNLERQINFAHCVEKFASRLAKTQRGLVAMARVNQMDELTFAYQRSALAALSRVGDAIPSWEAGETIADHLVRVQQTCHTTTAIVESAAVSPPTDIENFANEMHEWAKTVDNIEQEVNQHRVLLFLELSRVKA